MRTHTTSIEIECPPAHAFAFVADGGKLPVWAIGFAKAIEPDGERWPVTLASGERLPLRIDSGPGKRRRRLRDAAGARCRGSGAHARDGGLLFAQRVNSLKLDMERFTDAAALFRSHPELRTPPELVDAVMRAVA